MQASVTVWVMLSGEGWENGAAGGAAKTLDFIGN
jgi:hypothetical protein